MKAIVCEMCSSRDVIKQDGFFVCQSCGTKYSTDDAKKLMVEVEGKVDVSGSSVTVDNSQALNNMRKLAREARQAGDTESAAKYYEAVKMQDPSDWEAGFYSVFYAAANCTIAQIETAASRVSGCIPATFRKIKKTGGSAAEQKLACEQIISSTKALSSAFVKTAEDHFSEFSGVQGAAAERDRRVTASCRMVATLGDNMFAVFGDKERAVALYKECGLKSSEINDLIAKVDPEQGANRIEQERQAMVKGAIFCAIVGILGLVGGFLLKGGWSFGLYVLGGVFLFIAIFCVSTASSDKKKLNNLKK